MSWKNSEMYHIVFVTFVFQMSLLTCWQLEKLYRSASFEGHQS